MIFPVPTNSDLSVSVCVLDAETGVGARVAGRRPRPADRIGRQGAAADRGGSPARPRHVDAELPRFPALPEDAVADSGALAAPWRRARCPSADLAVLVGAVSDNLGNQRRCFGRLACRQSRRWSAMLELTGHPDCTTECAMSGVRPTRRRCRPGRRHRVGGSVRPVASRRGVRCRASAAMVLGWLNLDTDMSMVAGAFGLDPLAHTAPDRGWWLAHKTGTDTGIRADVGLVRGLQSRGRLRRAGRVRRRRPGRRLRSARHCGDRVRIYAGH